MKAVTVRVPPATFQSSSPLPHPRGALAWPSPAPHSPPVAVISLVVGRERGLPETKHWPGADPGSQPHPHLSPGKAGRTRGKSSLTGINWGSFPGTSSHPSERILFPVPSKERKHRLRPSFSLDVCWGRWI